MPSSPNNRKREHETRHHPLPRKKRKKGKEEEEKSHFHSDITTHRRTATPRPRQPRPRSRRPTLRLSNAHPRPGRIYARAAPRQLRRGFAHRPFAGLFRVPRLPLFPQLRSPPRTRRVEPNPDPLPPPLQPLPQQRAPARTRVRHGRHPCRVASGRLIADPLGWRRAARRLGEPGDDADCGGARWCPGPPGCCVWGPGSKRRFLPVLWQRWWSGVVRAVPTVSAGWCFGVSCRWTRRARCPLVRVRLLGLLAMGWLLVQVRWRSVQHEAALLSITCFCWMLGQLKHEVWYPLGGNKEGMNSKLTSNMWWLHRRGATLQAHYNVAGCWTEGSGRTGRKGISNDTDLLSPNRWCCRRPKSCCPWATLSRY